MIKMYENRTKTLHLLVKILADKAIKEIKQMAIEPLVVETKREYEKQLQYYGKGRSVTECRKVMTHDKALQYAKPKESKITWTLNSKHLDGLAIDVIPYRNKKAIWNAKDSQTKKIISTMKKYGFEAGANWSKNPDSPHFQIAVSPTKKTFNRSNTNKFITTMIQKKLSENNIYSGKIDGSWGSKTTKAVKKYRKKLGYTPSGKVGKATLKKMIKE